MKNLLFALFIICTVFISAHSQTMEGTYTNTWDSDAGGALTYTLTLNPDNTFVFVSHRVYEASIPPKTITANGTWDRRNRLLKLSTDAAAKESDLVEKLNRNKARFKSYSPRHRKYGKVKPSLRFFRSDVFYAKGMKLHKEDTDTVVSGF
jgi:hypothetical protein